MIHVHHETDRNPVRRRVAEPQDTPSARPIYRPAMDLFESAGRYEIVLDLPGANAEAIDVTVERGELSISATVEARRSPAAAELRTEYGVGDFRRVIRIGEEIDAEALEATFADGVLRLRVPKHSGRRSRRIEVRAG